MLKIGAYGLAVSGTFFLNIGEVALSFIIALLLTNLAGDSSFGAYSYVMALSGILCSLVIFGQDRLLVKLISSNISRTPFSEYLVLKKVVLHVVVFSFFVAIAVWVYIELTSPDIERTSALLVLPILVVLTVVIRILEAFAQGKQRVFQSLLANKLIRPVVFLGLIVFVYLSGEELTGASILKLGAASCVVTLVFLIFLVFRLGRSGHNQVGHSMTSVSLMRQAYPFAFIAIVITMYDNIGILVLGMHVSDADIGLYRISTRLADLVVFFVAAVDAVFGPRISLFYKEGSVDRIDSLAKVSSFVAFCTALPLLVGLVFWGREALLLFGADFVRADDALKILVVGKFVGVMAGSAGLILAMTQHEKTVLSNLLLSCILNAGLCFLLVPLWGVEGAAIAAVISGVFLAFYNLRCVVQLLSINSSLLSAVFFVVTSWRSKKMQAP